MSASIDFYFDFSSPYGYLASEKIEALERSGVAVTERVPCLVAPMDSTEDYLRTKKEKMGHLLEGF